MPPNGKMTVHFHLYSYYILLTTFRMYFIQLLLQLLQVRLALQNANNKLWGI